MTEAKQTNQTALLIKNALILFVITMVAGVLLGIVYELTKGEIAKQEAQAIVDANKAVFADASDFEDVHNPSAGVEDASVADAWTAVQGGNSSYAKVKLQSVTKALDGSGQTLGYIINVASSGYSSDITFSIGMTMEGHLNGISIISIAESPGLGMEADPVLVPQFKDRDDMPFTVKTVGDAGAGEIKAITAATISSRAVTNGVNAGIELFDSALKGGA